MFRLKSMSLMAAASLVAAMFATPLAAQEALGISTGPGPSADSGRGGPNQAIESIVGGTEFAIFNTDSTGDVVGFRFTMNSSQAVQSLGIWNGDTQAGGAGLTSSHQVGIWDEAQNLIASTTVTPSSPVTGDFRFEAITPVTLDPGVTYTIGALYTATDDDGYASGPTVTSSTEVNLVNAVFPPAGDLGFVFPTSDSAGNPGRIGPNFIFGPSQPPLPDSVAVPTLNGMGLLALILVLGVASIVVFRIRQA